MKTGPLPEHGKGSLWRVLALTCLASAVHGQQPPGYSYPPPPGYVQPAPAPSYPSQPPSYPQQRYPQQGYAQPEYQTEYVSPMEFLPTFGRKFGNMFRRVFYGDSAPSGYSPHGYPMPGSGHSLDSAPPSYQSHYGQRPPGIVDPRYEQPQGYPQQQQLPAYRQPPTTSQAPQPGVPQYQTPPTQQQAASPSASQPGSRMGSAAAPSTTVKPAPAPAPKSSPAPPKKYIPPTITKKQAPVLEEMPPPAVSKKETAAAGDTEYYPLPGAKPKTEDIKPSSTPKPSTSKPSTGTAGNNGAFLKGKKASKEGRVISPYPPYQELDVTGLSSGSLALDPTTQKVFEVP